MSEGFDMGGLFEQAQKMAADLQRSQQQLAETEIIGSAGGDVVRVTMTGAFEFRSVHIEPSAVDPDDVTMLEDLVLAALHDAAAQLAELGAGGMDVGGVDLAGIDLAGMDLGGLDLGGMALGAGESDPADDQSDEGSTGSGDR